MTGSRRRTRRGQSISSAACSDHSVTRRRLDGFRAALAARSRDYVDKPLRPHPVQRRPVRDVFADLFARENDIAGIFVNSLAVMEGLLLYFRENRERCRAVSYAVFDYHPFMEAVDLDYVCVRQNAESDDVDGLLALSQGPRGDRKTTSISPPMK